VPSAICPAAKTTLLIIGIMMVAQIVAPGSGEVLFFMSQFAYK
jgi:hypothetical protein